MPQASRQAIAGRLGALTSWANTVDRTARTRSARAKSPSNVEYHLERLDPERFADATDAQRVAAAESARRAHFAAMALKSAHARRRGGNDAPAA